MKRQGTGALPGERARGERRRDALFDSLAPGAVGFLSFRAGEDEEEYDTCGSLLVLRRGNCFRVFWTTAVCATLAYIASIFLYRLVFCSFHINEDGIDPIGVHDAGWNAIDTLVDYFFWIDLVLNFFFSYRDRKGNEIVSLRLIALKYMTGYFWVNLVACLPPPFFVVIVDLFSPRQERSSSEFNRVARVARLQRMSRLSRLVRVSRLVKLFTFCRGTQWDWILSSRKVRLASFIASLVWCLHFLACFWYLGAALHEDPRETWVGRRSVDVDGTSLLNQGPFEQWLVSMYFILTVFTTVGFGDISAGTEAEIMLISIIMVVGAVVHSIIISEVISLVTTSDHEEAFVEKQHKMIDAFSQHAKLSEATRAAVKDAVSWRARTEAVRHSYDKEEMLTLITGKTLPRSTLLRLAADLFDGRLQRNKFLRSCRLLAAVPPRLLVTLATALAWVDFDSQEIIYQMHDFAYNIFLVMGGTFAYVARPAPSGGVDEMEALDNESETLLDGPVWSSSTLMVSESSIRMSRCGSKKACAEDPPQSPLFPYRLFSCNNYFGEVEVLRDCPRKCTARCERPGGMLVLQKSDLAQVQEQFPQFDAAWGVAARNREHFRVNARQRLRLGQPVRSLAALQIQSYFRRRSRCLRGLSRAASSTALKLPGFMDSLDTVADAGMAALQKVDQVQKSVEAIWAELKAFREETRAMLKGKEVLISTEVTELPEGDVFDL